MSQADAEEVELYWARTEYHDHRRWVEKMNNPKRKRKAWKPPKMMTHYVELEFEQEKKVDC